MGNAKMRMDIPPIPELINWALYSCSPRQGELWDSWLIRAQIEWLEIQLPVDDSFDQELILDG